MCTLVIWEGKEKKASQAKYYGGELIILRLWRATPHILPLKDFRIPCTQDLLMWKKLKFLNIEFTWKQGGWP